jgi:hypothetical protein
MNLGSARTLGLSRPRSGRLRRSGYLTRGCRLRRTRRHECVVCNRPCEATNGENQAHMLVASGFEWGRLHDGRFKRRRVRKPFDHLLAVAVVPAHCVLSGQGQMPGKGKVGPARKSHACDLPTLQQPQTGFDPRKLLVGHDPAPYFTRRGLGCFIIVPASRRECADRAGVRGMLVAVSTRRYSGLVRRSVLVGRPSARLGGLCRCPTRGQGRRIYARDIFGMSEGGRRCVPGFPCGRGGLRIWTDARFFFRQSRSLRSVS